MQYHNISSVVCVLLNVQLNHISIFSDIDIGRVDISDYSRYPERLVPISLNLEDGSKQKQLALFLIKVFYFRSSPVTDKKLWIDVMHFTLSLGVCL